MLNPHTQTRSTMSVDVDVQVGLFMSDDENESENLENLVHSLASRACTQAQRAAVAHNTAFMEKWATVPMWPHTIKLLLVLARNQENTNVLCTDAVLRRAKEAAINDWWKIRQYAFILFEKLASRNRREFIYPYAFPTALYRVRMDDVRVRMSILHLFVQFTLNPELVQRLLDHETFLDTILEVESQYPDCGLRTLAERVITGLCLLLPTRVRFFHDARIMAVATRPRVGPYVLLAFIARVHEVALAMILQPRFVQCAVAGNNNTTLAERLVATVTETNALAILRALDAPLALQLVQSCVNHHEQGEILRRFIANRQSLRAAETFSTARDHSGRQTLGFLPSLLFSFLRVAPVYGPMTRDQARAEEDDDEEDDDDDEEEEGEEDEEDEEEGMAAEEDPEEEAEALAWAEDRHILFDL